jgi:predicted phosphodiesterase
VRIAVLADVHGNLPALEAVLADAARQGVERIVVNGDVVNRAPQGDAVMRRLTEVASDFTLGNHEDLLLRLRADDPELPDDLRRGPFWGANRWCMEELERGGWFARIATWPSMLRIETPGAPTLLVAHGSPRHHREGLGCSLPDATISEILQMHPTDVLIGSHTHVPMRRSWGRSVVLNTGAVGVPFNGDGRAQYLQLTLSGGVWRSAFRRVPYPVEEALAAFHATGYAAAGGLLARLFHDEVRDARSYLVPYQMWADRHAVALGRRSFARFRALHPNRFAPIVPWPTYPEEVES